MNRRGQQVEYVKDGVLGVTWGGGVCPAGLLGLLVAGWGWACSPDGCCTMALGTIVGFSCGSGKIGRSKKTKKKDEKKKKEKKEKESDRAREGERMSKPGPQGAGMWGIPPAPRGKQERLP